MAPQLKEILNLSLPERILWAEAIWNSITAEKEPFAAITLTAKEKNALNKISLEFEANPQIGSSWTTVKKRIQALKK